MVRPLLTLCFASALVAFGLTLPTAAAAATAGDPGAAVKNGTDPNDWFNSVKQPNWDVTEKISGGMTQILGQALLDLDTYKPTTPCKAAAFNQAWGALADAANGGPLGGFLDAIKDSLTGIQKVATFGADPEAAAEAIEAGNLAEQAFEEAKDKGSDWPQRALERNLERQTRRSAQAHLAQGRLRYRARRDLGRSGADLRDHDLRDVPLQGCSRRQRAQQRGQVVFGAAEGQSRSGHRGRSASPQRRLSEDHR